MQTLAIDWKLGAGFQSSGYGYIMCDANLLRHHVYYVDNIMFW